MSSTSALYPDWADLDVLDGHVALLGSLACLYRTSFTHGNSCKHQSRWDLTRSRWQSPALARLSSLFGLNPQAAQHLLCDCLGLSWPRHSFVDMLNWTSKGLYGLLKGVETHSCWPAVYAQILGHVGEYLVYGNVLQLAGNIASL